MPDAQPPRLFDCDRVKCRFSSPLEMVVDMVALAGLSVELRARFSTLGRKAVFGQSLKNLHSAPF